MDIASDHRSEVIALKAQLSEERVTSRKYLTMKKKVIRHGGRIQTNYKRYEMLSR